MNGPTTSFTKLAAKRLRSARHTFALMTGLTAPKQGEREARALERHLRKWIKQRVPENKKWKSALHAIDFMKDNTKGERDNGDPNIIHPLWMACVLTAVIDHAEQNGAQKLPDAPELMITLLCHDLLEDADITRSEFAGVFGQRCATGVYNMSNKYLDEQTRKRVRKSKDERIADLLTDPLSLIAKCIDRAHNFRTMVDIEPTGNTRKIVYTPQKVKEKLYEASRYIIPACMPIEIMGNYAESYHPFIQTARSVLMEEAGDVIGRMAKQDFMRTPHVVDNVEQRDRLIDVIRPPDTAQVGLHKNLVGHNELIASLDRFDLRYMPGRVISGIGVSARSHLSL